MIIRDTSLAIFLLFKTPEQSLAGSYAQVRGDSRSPEFFNALIYLLGLTLCRVGHRASFTGLKRIRPDWLVDAGCIAPGTALQCNKEGPKPGLWASNFIRPTGISAQRRIAGRHQKAVFYSLDNDRLRLGLGALGNPFLVALERIPLLLPFRQAFPFEKIGQRLVAGADQRGPEANGFDPVLFPELERDVFKTGVQRRQAAWRAVVDTHFMNHGGFQKLMKISLGRSVNAQAVRSVPSDKKPGWRSAGFLRTGAMFHVPSQPRRDIETGLGADHCSRIQRAAFLQ